MSKKNSKNSNKGMSETVAEQPAVSNATVSRMALMQTATLQAAQDAAAKAQQGQGSMLGACTKLDMITVLYLAACQALQLDSSKCQNAALDIAALAMAQLGGGVKAKRDVLAGTYQPILTVGEVKANGMTGYARFVREAYNQGAARHIAASKVLTNCKAKSELIALAYENLVALNLVKVEAQA